MLEHGLVRQLTMNPLPGGGARKAADKDRAIVRKIYVCASSCRAVPGIASSSTTKSPRKQNPRIASVDPGQKGQPLGMQVSRVCWNHFASTAGTGNPFAKHGRRSKHQLATDDVDLPGLHGPAAQVTSEDGQGMGPASCDQCSLRQFSIVSLSSGLKYL